MAKHPGTEVAAFMRQLKLLVIGAVAVLLVPLLIYAVYVDRRLDSIADSLRYRPPEASEDHAADGDFLRVASNPVRGGVVYVPAYSHVYHGDGSPLLLSITLSVRNTSSDGAIVVRSVRYIDTRGNEVRSYLKKPLRLPPLAATDFLIEREDTAGGTGASFLVEWFADEAVTEPIIEAVMIDTKNQQGISFAKRGVVIGELRPEPARGEAGETEGTEAPAGGPR